ncbi:MAG: molybdopterin-guanine dinucleotide biosynthesis protein B [Desulfurococcaceae archaeon]|nr:MAG: molybdopterin-guanine dinucleotide biosynthesis protein B [Desulfurococcaceae archaeon]
MVKCIVQVIGPSGSGKTSGIVKAVRKLKAMGYRVAVLKHTHHQIDVAHKDSWRYMEEGFADYSIVVMGSGERVAMFMRDTSLAEVLRSIEDKVDILLIEGFKHLGIGYKIELSNRTDPEELSETIVKTCLQTSSIEP